MDDALKSQDLLYIIFMNCDLILSITAASHTEPALLPLTLVGENQKH